MRRQNTVGTLYANCLTTTDPMTSNIQLPNITGSCDSADKFEAFHLGVDDYMLKPFAPSDLLISI